jgi:hypothetical protein
MLTLPQDIMIVLTPFMQVFSHRVWDWAQVLILGAILAPGKRTVTSALQVMGLKDDQQYQNYHRVLNRAKWSSLQASKILLGLLVAAFVSMIGPVVIGVDETLERRWGRRISEKGVFRDAARSSHNYTNFSMGLRWVSMMLLVPVPWSERIWGLPFFTVLAPNEKTNVARGRRHKSSVDWVMQMIVAVRRWLPVRPLVLVADGGMAAVKLGLRCRQLSSPTTFVSRLRLDAVLHQLPGPQPSSKPGVKPKKGERLPSLKAKLVAKETRWTRKWVDWYSGEKRLIEFVTGACLWYTPGFDPLPIRWVLVRDPFSQLEAKAYFATDQAAAPLQILQWFIMRWGLEVTFEEARAHLGLETQRQWSDLAIQRTTPALLGLFSLVTLLAHRLTVDQPFPLRRSAWYIKEKPTFSDTIALVRRTLWTKMEYTNSPVAGRFPQFSDKILAGLVETACYAT